MAWVQAWLKAFALTCALEIPIAAYMAKRAEESLARRAVLAFFAQLSTHVAVWFVIPPIAERLPYPAYVAVAETWAYGMEIVFYAFAFPRLGWKRAALVSVVANTVSFLAGLLVMRWMY